MNREAQQRKAVILRYLSGVRCVELSGPGLISLAAARRNEIVVVAHPIGIDNPDALQAKCEHSNLAPLNSAHRVRHASSVRFLPTLGHCKMVKRGRRKPLLRNGDASQSGRLAAQMIRSSVDATDRPTGNSTPRSRQWARCLNSLSPSKQTARTEYNEHQNRV